MTDFSYNETQYPKNVYFNISNLCNHRCRFCDTVHPKGRDNVLFADPRAFKGVEWLDKTGCVTLIGGERRLRIQTTAKYWSIFMHPLQIRTCVCIQMALAFIIARWMQLLSMLNQSLFLCMRSQKRSMINLSKEIFLEFDATLFIWLKTSLRICRLS